MSLCVPDRCLCVGVKKTGKSQLASTIDIWLFNIVKRLRIERERERKYNLILLIVFCLKTFSTQSNEEPALCGSSNGSKIFTTKSTQYSIYLRDLFFCSSCINNIILSEIYSRLAHFYSDFE